MRVGALAGLALYLGMGALFHALFVGSRFDWSSAWTWGWLLGWPVGLLITAGIVVVIFFVAIMLAALVFVVFEGKRP